MPITIFGQKKDQKQGKTSLLTSLTRDPSLEKEKMSKTTSSVFSQTKG